jgi:putative membrane protein
MRHTWKRVSLSLIAGCALATLAAGCGEDMSDGEILGALRTANAGEVELGNAALARSSHEAVRGFAQLMVDEHGAALADTNRTGDDLGVDIDEDNDISDELRNEVEDQRENLEESQGQEFDLEYMCGQIRIHRTVLDHIDDDLEPDAEAARVVGILNDTRSLVQRHLDEARTVTSQVGGGGTVENVCDDHGGI